MKEGVEEVFVMFNYISESYYYINNITHSTKTFYYTITYNNSVTN